MPRDFRLNPPVAVSIQVFDFGRDVNGNATAHHLITWDNGKHGEEYESGLYKTRRRQQVGYMPGRFDGALADLAALFPRTVWGIKPGTRTGARVDGNTSAEFVRYYELEPHPVIFRAVKSGEYKGTVDAFFPAQSGTNDLETCGAYSHIGQHCSASKVYYRDTRPATPEEIAPLQKELESIGYVLEVCNRWIPEFDAIRYARRNGRDT